MNAPWLVVQHVAWEGPGLIADEALRRGIALRILRVDRGERVASPDELGTCGGLVVMGGPMSVNDTLSHLEEERRLLRAAVERELPVLGVCLGAQLLAAALGARVFRGPAVEIGFCRVKLTAEGRCDPLLGPEGDFPAVHWHEETFELPRGASLLAGTDLYPHQVFRIGRRAYGFQCHVEVDSALADAWAARGGPALRLEASLLGAVERTGRSILGRFFESAAAWGRRP
ncbi:MAG: type 1 glutamine amidotransferase [Planctomycetota bacterium]